MADWSLYDRLGWSLFPIVPNGKVPAVEWEQYQSQRADPAHIAEWSTSACNTGVATGAVSGVFVLDLDGLTAWGAAVDRGLPDTLTVRTPRGWHYYFRHPGWPVRNRAGIRDVPLPDGTRGAKNHGWDIRGDGGYVVGPGSYYQPTPDEEAAGKVAGSYAVELDAPIAPAPEWLLAMLAVTPAPDAPPVPMRVAEQTSPYGQRAMHAELRDLADATQGHVNDQVNLTVFAIAQLTAGGEIVEDEARGAIQEILLARNIADEEKTQGTVERAWAAGFEQPRAAPVAASPLELFGAREPALGGEPALGLTVEPPAPFGPARPVALVAGGNLIVEYFQGCTYVATQSAIFVPGGVFLGPSQFDAVYGGPRFFLGEQGESPTRSAYECFTKNEIVRTNRVYSTCFRPEVEPGAIIQLEGLPHLNTYVPAQVRRVAGDAGPLIRHVRAMLPVGQDADYLLYWMASCVQNPGVKFQWWPVIQGVKGNGKTALLGCMVAAVGSRYSHLVNPEAMQKTGNQFNSWIERKLFLGFEEIRTGDGQHHFIEMMKDTVTNLRIAAEGKGRDQVVVDNRANGMMLTNWQDAVPVADDERRWGIFWCAQQRPEHLVRDGMDGDYFPRLYRWLRDEDGYAIVAHYLATLPIPAEMDPANVLHRAPETSSTAFARRASLGNIELEILEAIDEERHGFRGGFISSDALRGIMERGKVGRKRWAAILTALGYELHPRLREGRVSSPLADGTRPRLYVTAGHASLGLTGQAVGEAFDAAQAASTGGPASNVVPLRRV